MPQTAALKANKPLIFVTDKPNRDILIIRDMPLVMGLIAALLAGGAMAVAAKSADVTTSRIFFAFGVAVIGLAAVILPFKTLVLRRDDATLTRHERFVFRRYTTRHALSDATHAELIVSTDDEGDDLFQACLAMPNGKSIKLDDKSSLSKYSASIVVAINAWMERSGDAK